MKYFIIPLVVYPFDVMVSIDEPDHILLKRLIKYGNTQEECSELLNMRETSQGRTVMLPSNQTVIRLKTQLKKYDMISTMNHEVFHATTFIMHTIGVRFELFKSDEAYAYLIGYLTREISKRIKF